MRRTGGRTAASSRYLISQSRIQDSGFSIGNMYARCAGGSSVGHQQNPLWRGMATCGTPSAAEVRKKELAQRRIDMVARLRFRFRFQFQFQFQFQFDDFADSRTRLHGHLRPWCIRTVNTMASVHNEHDPPQNHAAVSWQRPHAHVAGIWRSRLG
jgi:hypothetical protein